MSYNILVRKKSNDMGDELCPAGRAVAQPISALFHGDTVFLHDLDDVCLSFSRRVIAALLCVCIQTAYEIQGTVWRKPGVARTLQPASFKHKNNTFKLHSQQLKTNFRRLNNHIRFYLWKRKIPPTQRSDDFVGWSKRQNESSVLRGGKNLHGE